MDLINRFETSEASQETALTRDWAEGQLCTGLFDGEVPDLGTVTIGRYSSDELDLESIKEECSEWCGLRSDSNCCFYWANDEEGQAFIGEVGQYGCGISAAETTQNLRNFFAEIVEEFAPIGLE